MPSAHEHFSEQFQKWEKRGRGWHVYDEPVFPEPPFVPFVWRAMTETPAVDNGRRPSFLGSLFRKVAAPQLPLVAEPEPEEEPAPLLLVRENLVELQISLPDDFDVSHDALQQFFLNLSLCREPVAFELLGTHRRITVQFVASEEDASQIRKQLRAYFPEVTFLARESMLEAAWDKSQGEEVAAVEFGLEREFMFPLASGKLDPFVGIIGTLTELEPGELGLFQVLFQPTQENWSESIVNSVTTVDGKPFFVNEPELTGAAETKVSSPIYAAVVRIMVRTASTSRLHALGRGLAGALSVFANPQGNALIPLKNDEYPLEDHIHDVLFRQSRRTGMLLNMDELIGFVHLPGSAVRSSELLRDSGSTKAAPAIVSQPPGVIIGDNEHNGEIVPVFLCPNQRVRHTHIIGSNGTGKSSLLLNLIRQDIENGDGIAVLDPHGDLIDQILDFIPAERINDVVLVDPADIEFPIGFNLLQAHSEEERRLLASDLVSVFRRLATSWGDQMDTVLQNSILVILDSTRGGTLADLRRFLLEKDFRSEFLETVQDPELIYYWQKVFPQLGGGKSIGSVLTRLQDFFSQRPLRNMVSQRKNLLDFENIMDTGKIFLAKLSEGLCGEENSYLLGTLLIGKFQQLAMARQSQKMESRRDFWLYIDEFQHFISPSMAKILTGARKYRLGLTLAHQDLHQLQSDAKVASAVMTQPCTRIVLRVGDDDAKKLGEGFASFDVKSLTRLEKYHAIARVEQNDFDFNLALRKPELPTENGKHKAAIIKSSRTKYATPRSEVEAALLAGVRLNGKTSSYEADTKPHAGKANRTPEDALTSSASTVEQHPESSHSVEMLKPKEMPHRGPKTVVTVSEIKLAEAIQTNSEPKDLGRGKAQHQAIQKRLRDEVSKLGFSAEIEKQLKKGSNESADVVVCAGDMSIAVEIAVTSEPHQEFAHIQNNIDTGFTHIAVVSTDRKKLERIADAVQGGLGGAAASKVSYYSPDEFINHIEKIARGLAAKAKEPSAPANPKIHGRTVTVSYAAASPEEQQAKDEALNKVLWEATKSPKRKNK